MAHRGDLHGVFLRACQADPLVELRTGCAIVGYGQDGSVVAAEWYDAPAWLHGGNGLDDGAAVLPLAWAA